ncbi:MAG TPA: sensor domain-containing diguanylate cyclase [Longimicrobiales bacterium]
MSAHAGADGHRMPTHHPQSPGLKERYAVLLDIARRLAATRRPEDLYVAIYEQSSRVLETTGFFVSLYDAETDTATIVFLADRGRIDSTPITYRGSDSAVIRERRPILRRLDERDPSMILLGPQDDEITRSAIAAPMLRGDRMLGVICAQSYRLDAYSEADLELLVAVADQAAVALENALDVAEMERRRREAERLEEIGRALTSSLELSEVLERIVRATLELVEAEAASVWLLTGEREVEVALSRGPVSLDPGMRATISDELYRRVCEQRETLVFDDIKGHALLPLEVRDRVRLACGVVVPLVAEGAVIGALTVGNQERRRYSADDLRVLERLSHQAGIAVGNARLHERIRALSLTDPLTGLANRRHLAIHLEREFAAARRGRLLTVLLFDLDRFKEYNDAAGHQAGDEALRAFARILRAETRAMNLTARYGGDEFIAVLSDGDMKGGLTLAERISRSMEIDPLLGPAGVRASVGVATYTPEMNGPDDLIRAADRDLYRRKAEREASTAAPPS